MKRLGPELKMPKLNRSDLKVPPFLADLYWDLWDRRLLPLVAVVVVAIAAVPFLLSGGSKESPAPSVPSGTGAAIAAETGSPSTFTVVQAEPGLRDYRKRLARRSPTDPFKQRYTAPVITAHLQAESPTTTTTTTSSTASSASITSTSSTTVTSETSHSPPSGGGKTGTSGGGAPSGGGGGGKPDLTFYTWAIDVQISKSGGKDADPNDQEPSIKHGVLPQTSLPGPKAPVVTYMGLSRKAAEKRLGKVLLLVSDEVKSVSGEAKCVSGGEVCQLFEVEPGSPLTFVYGPNEVRYRINVLKIELVVTGHS